MNNKVFNVLSILIVLIVLFSINTNVYAFGKIIQDGKAFIGSADTSDAKVVDATAVNNGLKDISGFLYNVLLSAGVVIAVIVGTTLGIKFMIGGVEGQVKVKEMLIPFVIGCMVIFGAFGIWKIALNIGSRLESGSSGGGGSKSTDTEIVEPDKGSEVVKPGKMTETIKPGGESTK